MALIDQFVSAYLRTEDFTGAVLDSSLSPVSNPREYYVYVLIDPRFNKIFYVGKGKRRRAWSHEAGAPTGKLPKDAKIREINAEGHKIDIAVLCDGLSESLAYTIESYLIDRLRDCDIVNLVGVKSETRREREMRRADALLRQVVSYERWLCICNPQLLRAVSRIFGSTRIFYDKFVAELQHVKAHPQIKEIVLVG